MRAIGGWVLVLCVFGLPRLANATTPLKAGHWQGPPDGYSRYRFCVEIQRENQIILTFSRTQLGPRRRGDTRLVARGRYRVVRRQGGLVELLVTITRMDHKGYAPCRKTVNERVDAATVLGRRLEIGRADTLRVRLHFEPAQTLRRACVLGVQRKKKHWFCQPMQRR
ncbi:MAG: hypothetical protein KC609_00985 [Myxococcales bacterium]|nr:hypothetical protein [Myxococcales bacterium]